MFYAVSINRQVWTQGEVTIEALQARGFEVCAARRIGAHDVFHNGRKVATLFVTKAEAAAYVAGA